MVELTIMDLVIYYLGIICAIYIGYVIGNDNSQLQDDFKKIRNKLNKLDKKIKDSDDNLTRKDIEKIMQSPKYWRDQDPEVLKIVADWFEKQEVDDE